MTSALVYKIIIMAFNTTFTSLFNNPLETTYEHIFSSMKITLLKEKEFENVKGRNAKRFKVDKTKDVIVVEQLDFALLCLRLLASRVPSRADQLAKFLTGYSENFVAISKPTHEKIKETAAQIKSAAK